MSVRVVVDIETLGKKPGCVVLAVGAVAWRDGIACASFYRVIDLEDSIRLGMAIDGDTLRWWLQQPREAFEAAIGYHGAQRGTALEVMTEFQGWGRHNGCAEYYGNSPSFDLSILEALMDRVGVAVPWEYWQERCVRTELAMYERLGVNVPDLRKAVMESMPAVHIKHHALHDAGFEVELLIQCERELQRLFANPQSEIANPQCKGGAA